MNSYQIAVEALQKMNEEHGDVWKLPPFKHSLMFAICEFAEAIDAELRTYPEYFRNRELNADFEEEKFLEVCDGIMMVIKALMSVNYNHNFEAQAYPYLDSSLDTELYRSINVLSEIMVYVDKFPYYSGTSLRLEYMLIDIIFQLEKVKGEGYVGRAISAKMDKTRQKILARKAAEANV